MEDWVHAFSDIYGDASSHLFVAAEKRLRLLHDSFISAFSGAAPALVARAPGRVNLIGEHIDYEGYGVLPMAIDNDTMVAARVLPLPSDSASLTIVNTDGDEYPTHTFADPMEPVDVSNHLWANYFLAAYKGIFEHAKATMAPDDVPAPRGMEVVVSGIVPTGSGLSSSSAFVVAAALAVMAGHELRFSLAEVAELTCRCERHVGVMSGGMDQAISVFGQRGRASFVQFNPIRTFDVLLPQGSVFVIANSLAVSKKADTAKDNYNVRVVECTLAAIVLAILEGKMSPADAREHIKTLYDVESLLKSRERALKGARDLLHDGFYSFEELEGLLGSPMEHFLAGSEAQLAVLPGAKLRGGFKIRDRAIHVYSEATRVDIFQDICKKGDDSALSQLGAVMNESHTSCAELYECSCSELDELVAVCRNAGAFGSRLTGAGWGGCTVSLVSTKNCDEFLKQVKERFYKGKVHSEDMDRYLFSSVPGAGAALFTALS